MRALVVLVWCCLGLSAVEVAFEGRQVVFDAPADGAASGVVVWFHDAASHVEVDAGWWHGHGFPARGLAVAVPPGRLQWNPEVDSLFAARLVRELQRRLGLGPERTIIGGAGDGAAFAMHLATRYQGTLCTAALLVRGGASGRWREAGDDPPLIGIYANANDPTVPIRSLRSIQQRLERGGYPVAFTSALAGSEWGPELDALVGTVCAERGIALAPAAD